MTKDKVSILFTVVVATIVGTIGLAVGSGRTNSRSERPVTTATPTLGEQLRLSACIAELEGYETAYESCDGTRAWLLTQYEAAKQYHTDLLACREGATSIQSTNDELRRELNNAQAEKSYYAEQYRTCLLSRDGE